MTTIRFKTTAYRPILQVTLRGNSKVNPWKRDIPGIYTDSEWRFEVPEDDYPDKVEFQFFLNLKHQMKEDNRVHLDLW